MEDQYYIDIQTLNIYRVRQGVCVNLSKYDVSEVRLSEELPKKSIPLKVKRKTYYKVLFCTSNLLLNIRLFLNKKVHLYIQSEYKLHLIKSILHIQRKGIRAAKLIADKLLNY